MIWGGSRGKTLYCYGTCENSVNQEYWTISKPKTILIYTLYRVILFGNENFKPENPEQTVLPGRHTHCIICVTAGKQGQLLL